MRVNHCVSRRDVLAEFMTGNLCLDVCNKVLDVADSLSLLGNQLHHIRRRVVAHQELVKVFVADVENLKKRAKLMSVRHLQNKEVRHVGLSHPKATPTFSSLDVPLRTKRLAVDSAAGLLLVFYSSPLRFLPDLDSVVAFEPRKREGRQGLVVFLYHIGPRPLVEDGEGGERCEVHRCEGCCVVGRCTHSLRRGLGTVKNRNCKKNPA